MADLDALRGLYAWMREENILYARCGELELRIEPAPPALRSVVDLSPTPDADADAQRALEDLLHSSGVDPAMFVGALKRHA